MFRVAMEECGQALLQFNTMRDVPGAAEHHGTAKKRPGGKGAASDDDG